MICLVKYDGSIHYYKQFYKECHIYENGILRIYSLHSFEPVIHN